ncbi:MAG: excinuclease ABC subunit B [Chloroflexi bacterium]|jgi:excinuclease ABC subunit B|nr:MAG: excinuclease ABC subunit B [Chloroflexota bacterium]
MNSSASKFNNDNEKNIEGIFKLHAPFNPTGDQPAAIKKLTENASIGIKEQTLLGTTGSGKTYTMANMINNLQKPTLVIAHNRTLAAQLVTEFRDFFPNNSVEYFVSYYDYYQPEAYVPRTDTYIDKDASINDEIDKMRHSATRALFERKDVIIVASVSCIYGLAEPGEYEDFIIKFFKGRNINRNSLIRQFISMQYERNDIANERGTFRVRGDSITVFPVHETHGIRIDFWGDVIEKISVLNPVTGEIIEELTDYSLYPAKHFVTSSERLELAIADIEKELSEQIIFFKNERKFLEAQRIEERTKFDIATLKTMGYCGGVENYSRHLSRRKPGSTPWTLLDYFPDDWLLFIDESHITIPQIRGMYNGDTSRKKTLVEYGFRLPSAIDNRPLNFDEFIQRINYAVYVSATPNIYEIERSSEVIEQVIRPTGLVDPTTEIHKTEGQIDDLINEINNCINNNERVLITTLTKKMSEELSEYLIDSGIKATYLHSELDTFERVEIIRNLRLGEVDVVVGINLLREGLDIPEVALVCILDADKEGFLRSKGSLIQTMGRAARNPNGRVILYADIVTKSMQSAIDETDRRRKIQHEYNIVNKITPTMIKKNIKDINDTFRKISNESSSIDIYNLTKYQAEEMIRELKDEMDRLSKLLEYEKAALIRDQIKDIRKIVLDDSSEGLREFLSKQ